MRDTTKLIKKIVSSVIGEKLDRIILFGSRAKGVARFRSDYDLLIVLDEKNLDMSKKLALAGFLRRKLAEADIDADVIIKSQNEMDYFKDKIGSVVKTALKEGVVL